MEAAWFRAILTGKFGDTDELVCRLGRGTRPSALSSTFHLDRLSVCRMRFVKHSSVGTGGFEDWISATI
jgi:hypothetical protein